MAQRESTQGEIPELHLHGARETIFFSEVDGRLCQWVEVELSWDGWRANLEMEVRAAGRSERRELAIFGGGRTKVRCPAPVVWPDPPDTDARLVVRQGGRIAALPIAVGTHRPWTIYLLSDLCADDVWAYDDRDAHDRDDYLTTLAELDAAPENRYNFAAAYQVARFRRFGSPSEKRRLRTALREGRFYVTPVPNQLQSAAFHLSAFPLLLKPYRDVRDWADLPDALTHDAYHMEGPTWPNGLVNLLACAGFHSFGKSMLKTGRAENWVDGLRTIPRFLRLQVAPGRFVYLLMRCGDYSEGSPVLAGSPHVEFYLHDRVIPAHEALGDAYPTTAIPLVGAYSDLCPAARRWAAQKVDAVRRYNEQWWDYPKLVNATWTQFFDHVVAEVGPPERPRRAGLRTVHGDTGACWEAWLLRIQAEAARFRAAQRDLVSVRTLCAMLGRRDARTLRRLDEATLEMVHLGDHAWNGSSPGNGQVNLAIRRGRLDRLEAAVSQLRASLGGEVQVGRRVAVVNTLGWVRACAVPVPEGLALADPETGERCAVRRGQAVVPDVPGLGVRVLRVCEANRTPNAGPRGVAEPPVALDSMAPRLLLGREETDVSGGWRDGRHGEWRVGPFTVRAEAAPAATADGVELRLAVEGAPPEGGYSLRWRFDLPWPRAVWRVEAGGGFTTPGADSLLGIVGSCTAVGGGLSAAAPGGRTCIDFALDESGICGLGGPTAGLAVGDLPDELKHTHTAKGALRGRTTDGVLEWYLLSTEPLPHEQIPDQGGARSWRFRCALRARRGGFDDVALYRFATGYAWPGELVCLRQARRIASPWLTLKGGSSVLVLGAAAGRDGAALDLYNTSARRATVRLQGAAVEGRKLVLADMLGRPVGPCKGPVVSLLPQAFVKVLLGR